MKCLCCNNIADERPHHIIFRNKVQCGTNHPLNLVCLCIDCHTQIHHGKDTKLKKEIMKKCYDYIRDNIDLCWSSKRGIVPKVVRLIKAKIL